MNKARLIREYEINRTISQNYWWKRECNRADIRLRLRSKDMLHLASLFSQAYELTGSSIVGACSSMLTDIYKTK